MSKITKVESASLGLGLEKEVKVKDKKVITQDILGVILLGYEGHTDISGTSVEVSKSDTTTLFKGGKIITVNYLTASHTHRYSSTHRAGTNSVFDPSDPDRKAARKQKGLIQYTISGGTKREFKISD